MSRVGSAVTGQSAYAGGLLAVSGLLAWATGQPLIFPSLGPSAFVMARGRTGLTARRVVGGHALGVVAGLLAYHALAPGLVVTAPTDPFAVAQFRLVASGVVAVALTAATMSVADAVHPPACATTLIVSLGLLPSFAEGALVVGSVAVLFAAYRVTRRVGVGVGH